MKHIKYLVFSFFLSIISTNGFSQEKPLAYENESLSFAERAKDLVSRMTLQEKITQMVNDAPAIPRLNIPEYNWWNECLHGLARAGKATIFPQAIGLGATFDEDLLLRIGDAISDEARAFYNAASKRGNRGLCSGLTFYSPNVNIYRDPRWGRGQETYGEDPYLTSLMGAAFVNGLQGGNGKYLKAVACAKHYAVHSGPEEFRHEFNAVVSNRDLYETYLPAFKCLVKEAHVGSVMGAYNRTNGEACCGSKTLLQDILRDQWGFKGYVTSDCGALVDFHQHHKICKTPEESAALAIKSGLNLNCGSLYNRYLENAVKDGLVTEKEIDDLLETLMVARFKLGLFDKEEGNPYAQITGNVVDSKEHKDLAYEAAVKSIVLLENKKNVLPLKKSINYLFVTGPNANNADALIGNYFGVSDNLTTYLEGLVNEVPLGVSVQYKQGVMLDKPNTNPIDWTTGEAARADAVVACVGLSWLLEGEEGEAIASKQKGDMINNSLPPAQIAFLKKLKARIKDKPLIVVVSGGCPVQLNEIKELADALLYAWYPGEAGGKALADLIFGEQNPSGRLPITFVKSLNQLPAFEDYAMKGRTYKYMSKDPLYHFGYGLSYSKFKYSNLRFPKKIKAGESFEGSVTITNTSNMAGEEVAQIYVKDLKSSCPVPIRQLAGIKRVNLKPHESKTIRFSISPLKMSLINNKDQRIIEAGEFSFSVGGGQPIEETSSYLEGLFNVKGKKHLEL